MLCRFFYAMILHATILHAMMLQKQADVLVKDLFDSIQSVGRKNAYDVKKEKKKST